MKKSPDVVMKQVERKVLSEFRSDLDRQISQRTHAEIHFQLSRFDANKAILKDEIIDAVSNFTSNVDGGEIYDRIHQLFSEACKRNDYRQIIKFFNRKGLRSQIAPMVGMQAQSFPQWFAETLKELIDNENRELHVEHNEATEQYLPENPTPMPQALLVAIRELFPKIPTQ